MKHLSNQATSCVRRRRSGHSTACQTTYDGRHRWGAVPQLSGAQRGRPANVPGTASTYRTSFQPPELCSDSPRSRVLGLTPQAIESLVSQRRVADAEEMSHRVDCLLDHVRPRNSKCDPRAPSAHRSLSELHEAKTQHHGFATLIQA